MKSSKYLWNQTARLVGLDSFQQVNTLESIVAT